MSTPTVHQMPVGVRAVTGQRTGRLTWVSAGAFVNTDLRRGSRLLVRDGDRTWLAEVVAPAGQLLESPPLSGLPVVVRLAEDPDAWPATPERAGRALLDSLKLAPELLEPSAG